MKKGPRPKPQPPSYKVIFELVFFLAYFLFLKKERCLRTANKRKCSTGQEGFRSHKPHLNRPTAGGGAQGGSRTPDTRIFSLLQGAPSLYRILPNLAIFLRK